MKLNSHWLTNNVSEITSQQMAGRYPYAHSVYYKAAVPKTNIVNMNTSGSSHQERETKRDYSSIKPHIMAVWKPVVARR